jgi:hypothetical protein
MTYGTGSSPVPVERHGNVSFESLLLLDVVTWTRTQRPNPSPGSTVHTDGWQPAHGSWTHGLGSGRVGASNGQGHELAITWKRLIIFFYKSNEGGSYFSN